MRPRPALAPSSGFVGVSEQPYAAMEMPNLYVMILDILTRVFECSRVVRRYEIMASHDFASQTQRKCSIVRHDGRPRVSTALQN